MKVGRLRDGDTTHSAKFLDEIEEREEIFAGLAERNVFCLHCGEGDLSLKLTLPNNGAVGNTDNTASTTSDTMWILGVFMVVETSEVGVRIAINVEYIGWAECYAFCARTFKVSTDTLERSDMSIGGLKGISCTL
jgi:hypothetical protein